MPRDQAISYRAGAGLLELVDGDITRQSVDAIVNAANSGLAGGAGVDGAIHRVGGPSIMAQCRRIGGCPTGQAVVTEAGNLPCRWVIHTVGPIWSGGTSGEPALLESAYRQSVARARELTVGTLAFPSLSTGAYGYPLAEAARVALGTIADELVHGGVECVRFVLFGSRPFRAYHRAAEALLGSAGGQPDTPPPQTATE